MDIAISTKSCICYLAMDSVGVSCTCIVFALVFLMLLWQSIQKYVTVRVTLFTLQSSFHFCKMFINDVKFLIGPSRSNTTQIKINYELKTFLFECITYLDY